MTDAQHGARSGETIVAGFTTETHGAYLDMCKRSKWGHKRVAAAWRENRALVVGNLATDGQTVTSYDHPIGRTLEDGTKLAYQCQASKTTVKHCGTVAVFADRVEDCPCPKGWAAGEMGNGPTHMPRYVREIIDAARS